MKCIQTDHAKELLTLALYLNIHGIHYCLTHPHTHEQDGCIEHKHRHITDTSLSLLANASLPKFWGKLLLLS